MVDSIDHRVDIANLREEDRQALEKGYDDRGRIYITKIRDSEAGGLHSVKHEDYFHGFMPKEQVFSKLVTPLG
ncbi:unnamed protein product [Cylicostephanus goldi]|uniref:Uncharacterized protein n=1 Tax=Cylicostephanus goldi TaxID=71465 RepID=A0A3P6TU64_CYLGO|nr:unnamed protein product [Cylicostephanus goldi]